MDEAASGTSNPKARRILVAEDDEAIRAVCQAMLTHLEYESVLTADGEEALERFDAEPDSFCCALLDLRMPRRRGDAVLSALHERRADLPAVIMSGAEDASVTRCAGVFLRKPFRLDDLRAVLATALAAN